jgi:hypothetical protein
MPQSTTRRRTLLAVGLSVVGAASGCLGRRPPVGILFVENQADREVVVTVRIDRVESGGPDGVGETPTAGWTVDTTRTSRLTVPPGARRRDEGLFKKPGFHRIEAHREGGRSTAIWFEVFGWPGVPEGANVFVTVEDDGVDVSVARYD